MSKEILFNYGKLDQKKPLIGVEAAIKDLEEFPIGLLDESEREVFAAARAALGEAQVIARRKGIELGFTVKKPSVWDRFRRMPQYRPLFEGCEVRYKGLPVHLLQVGDISVASGTQCIIEKGTPGSDSHYKQREDTDVYYLPYKAEYPNAYYSSRFGRDFIAIGTKSKKFGIETAVQLKEHNNLPVFVVCREKDHYSAKPVAAS